MANIHSFDVLSIGTDLFLFTLILRILATEILKDKEGIALNLSPNILTQCPLQTSVDIISSVFR